MANEISQKCDDNALVTHKYVRPTIQYALSLFIVRIHAKYFLANSVPHQNELSNQCALKFILARHKTYW